jgi:hypothetical protein
MNKYKVYKGRRFNWWFGIWQTDMNIRNVFIIYWTFIRERRFGITLFQFIFPDKYGGHASALFRFHFSQYRYDPLETNMQGYTTRAYISFQVLYLPSLDFRVGNGKTWLSIRSENYYAWKVNRQNKKAARMSADGLPF